MTSMVKRRATKILSPLKVDTHLVYLIARFAFKLNIQLYIEFAQKVKLYFRDQIT